MKISILLGVYRERSSRWIRSISGDNSKSLIVFPPVACPCPTPQFCFITALFHYSMRSFRNAEYSCSTKLPGSCWFHCAVMHPTYVERVPPFFRTKEKFMFFRNFPPVDICLCASKNIKLPFCNSLSYNFFLSFSFVYGKSPNVLKP
jgi:hypothetical protein